MTKIFVYGSWGRLPLNINTVTELYEKVKSHLKIEHCKIYKNREETETLEDSDTLQEGARFYVVAEIEKKEVKADLCNHPPDKKCLHCATEEIIANNSSSDKKKPKYLPYKMYKDFLEEKGKQEDFYDYIKKICDNHGPNIVCGKCMDKTITFTAQLFRKIDYIEFDQKNAVEDFINRWKNSQKQELGLLVGNHIEVEGTTRAVVSAISIPEQQTFPDGIHLETLQEDEFTSLKNSPLKTLGLIYTDLFIEDKEQISYKIQNNFLISSNELEFFYKTMKALGKDDDFVFVCVSTDEDKQICLNCFQLSKQFIALMDAQLLKLSNDPTAFISNTKRDLLYMYRNEYNIDVSAKADPEVPLEYFFVTCETGHSPNSIAIFSNTEVNAPLSTLKKISGYLDAEYYAFEKFKNYTFLLSLQKFYKNTAEIYRAVVANDEVQFSKALDTDEFVRFMQKLEENHQAKWHCAACTFLNDSYLTQCDICGTPKIEE